MVMWLIESRPTFWSFKAVYLVIAAIISVVNRIINCFSGTYQGRNYGFYLAKAAKCFNCYQTAGLDLDTFLPATPAHGIFSHCCFDERFPDRVC